MKSISLITRSLICGLLILKMSTSVAATITNNVAQKTNPTSPNSSNSTPQKQSSVEKRIQQEKVTKTNPFVISFYKPTYILPVYYNSSPDRTNAPDGEALNQLELKFQLSFKVPVWQNIAHRPSTLYFAYTQLSYWQVYHRTAFFRETNYEPEIFVANQVNWALPWQWKLDLINVGAVHQSNGRGGISERSWNRIYAEAIATKNNWMVSIKPWYIIPDSTMRDNNSNIGNYLGYGKMIVAYKLAKQVFSVEGRNLLESGFQRSALQFNWNFPIVTHLSGYVQVFTGYGQSLIEYDHHTNSIGIGVSLSNWG